MAKKGLGKGLDALLPEQESSNTQEKDVQELSIFKIEPNKKQPRKDFNEEKIQSLSDSIKEHGIIQPIIVKSINNGMYIIVSGERRWRAAKKAGLKTIPCIVKEYSDEQIAQIALIENLQREDLNPIEEALGYQSLLDDFNLTQELISKKIGKSRSAIANSLRLLSLEENIKNLLISGDITGGHARAILSLSDSNLRLALAKKIINDNLNVRQAEAIAKQLQKQSEENQKEKKEKEKTPLEIELDNIQTRLSSNLGTKVKISNSGKKGKIEIEYYGTNDLERILNLIS